MDSTPDTSLLSINVFETNVISNNNGCGFSFSKLPFESYETNLLLNVKISKQRCLSFRLESTCDVVRSICIPSCLGNAFPTSIQISWGTSRSSENNRVIFVPMKTWQSESIPKNGKLYLFSKDVGFAIGINPFNSVHVLVTYDKPIDMIPSNSIYCTQQSIIILNTESRQNLIRRSSKFFGTPEWSNMENYKVNLIDISQ
jgi:hypothetical protein